MRGSGTSRSSLSPPAGPSPCSPCPRSQSFPAQEEDSREPIALARPGTLVRTPTVPGPCASATGRTRTPARSSPGTQGLRPRVHPGYVDIDEVDPSPGAFTLTWKPPADIGGSAVTSYDLRYLLADDPDQSNWTEVTNVGSLSDRRYTLTGWTAKRSTSSWCGPSTMPAAGPWSEPYAEETYSVSPGAPRSVSVAASDRALAVSWQEPAYLGMGATAYDVRSRKDVPGEAWNTMSFVWTVGAGDLRYVIRGLVNGARYEVQGAGEERPGRGGVVRECVGHTGRDQQPRRVPPRARRANAPCPRTRLRA